MARICITSDNQYICIYSYIYCYIPITYSDKSSSLYRLFLSYKLIVLVPWCIQHYLFTLEHSMTYSDMHFQILRSQQLYTHLTLSNSSIGLLKLIYLPLNLVCLGDVFNFIDDSYSLLVNVYTTYMIRWQYIWQ